MMLTNTFAKYDWNRMGENWSECRSKALDHLQYLKNIIEFGLSIDLTFGIPDHRQAKVQTWLLHENWNGRFQFQKYCFSD